MSEARKLETGKLDTGIKGLSTSIGEDGVWLNFHAEQNYAHINLTSTYSDDKVVGAAILKGCELTASSDEPTYLQRLEAVAEAAKGYRQAVEDEESYSVEEVVVLFDALDKLEGAE